MSDVLIAADFETTVYKGQKKTEVWAAAYAELFSEKVIVHKSIEMFINDLISYRRNITCWFHNLRFDGSFILNYLLRNDYKFNKVKQNELKSKEFSTVISGQNRWYCIIIKTPYATIKILDSAKLMPMNLDEVGKAFDTKHRKLSMEYEGKRYAGCNISKEEMEYIVNDVLVLKEALEVMVGDGYTKMTIGSCALSEYKTTVDKYEYKKLFPDLSYSMPDGYGSKTADEYCRKSYKGGFCFCKKKGRALNGATYDVNGLYTSVMHRISGNRYPIGKPKFFKGKIPDVAYDKKFVFIVRFKCRFQLKKGYLPTVQIKGNSLYLGTEWLETSDIYYRGKYYKEIERNGEVIQGRPELTMTSVDWKLFLEHYDISELEILDGCYFHSRVGLFDEYIEKWSGIKKNSKGGKRTEAKLFLNNLYGKFASSDDSSYRVPELDESGALCLELVEEHEKRLSYIPVGTFVTSYARDFTIRAAQANYDNFCYSDTDSIHVEGDSVFGIDIDDKEMLKWKKESEWSSGIFLRQKTYAEFVRVKNGDKVYPHWEITCAGMPERSKKLFLATHPITDFKPGLKVGGKLVPRQIQGGVVLEEKTFTLKHKTR